MSGTFTVVWRSSLDDSQTLVRKGFSRIEAEDGGFHLYRHPYIVGLGNSSERFILTASIVRILAEPNDAIEGCYEIDKDGLARIVEN